MKSVLITLFCLLNLFVIPGHTADVQMISKLIQDLVNNERVPAILSVVSCWSQLDNIFFYKSSNVTIQLSVQMEISRQRFDYNTNKMWYFIDMRCTGSYEFLERVEYIYFGHPYRWILFEANQHSLLNLPFLTDSNVILINFDTSYSRFNLKQGYSEQNFSLTPTHELVLLFSNFSLQNR